MAMQTTFLRSRVARRIFVLFVGCALVPIVALTILSFYEVSNQLKSESQKQLQDSTKAGGFAIIERLTILDTQLQVKSLQVAGRKSIQSNGDIGDHFKDITVVNDGLAGLPLLITAASSLTNVRSHLESGKTLIKTAACPADRSHNCVFLVRMIDSKRPELGMLIGQPDATYLWGSDQLPTGFTACILDSLSRPLYCSGASPPYIGGLGSHKFSGSFQWTQNDSVYDAAYWSLLLKPQFAAEPWTIVLSRNHQDGLAPMEHFRNVFPFVIALAIWCVALFSLIQIRRTLVPLEKLREGTRQIGDHNFESRVDIHSGDEFQDLASSFNSMSAKLGRQFQALTTINEIDRAILASLNRDGILAAVLHGVADLLPCDCWGVALFEEDHENGLVSANITSRKLESGEDTTVQSLKLATSDLRHIRQNADVQFFSERGRVPSFLSPFREQGMKVFLVAPVFLDQELLAAIVCARSSMISWGKEEHDHARRIADQLAVAFSNVRLNEAREKLHFGALTALARAIDASSPWTGGHSERVTELSISIGRGMGLGSKDLLVLHRGGLLHDIGKIGTPPGILEKPGRLNAEELKVMRDHVRMGVRILEPIPSFKEELLIAAQHHEWFDGSGYPAGLAGEEISLLGRIFAVADCYDALISDRPYRKGMPKDKAMELLRQESGTHFDPRVLEAFYRLFTGSEVVGSARGQSSDLVEHIK